MTPLQLARDVAAARAAGADAVHLHVKNDEGEDTLDARAVAAVLTEAAATAPDVPIGVTTGAWAAPDPAERVAAIRSWIVLPAFASVNWHEDGADEVADTLLARGVGVEAGLWHESGVEAWAASSHRRRCLRVLLELPDGLDAAATTVEATRLLEAVRAVDEDAPILLHGEGSSAWPALRCAGRWGLDTRVGLEDMLVLPDGSPAPDNAALVKAARALLDA